MFNKAGRLSARKFGLKDDIYFVKGARRGAIYDLNTGEVYSLHERAVQVLDLTLEGQTTEAVGSVIPGLGTEGVYEFLEAMVAMNLGEWYDGPPQPVKSYRDLPRPTPKLRFAQNGCSRRMEASEQTFRMRI